MNQEQYDRLCRARECCARTVPTEMQLALLALLEAFEELHQALDEALEDHDPALDPPGRDLCAVLFNDVGDYRLRVRKP